MSLILLDKSAHSALWGSESWEISSHPADPSVIADEEEKGRRLNEIYPNFPLLFKVIDAKTRLSVQVHPNEETCKVTGGELIKNQEHKTRLMFEEKVKRLREIKR